MLDTEGRILPAFDPKRLDFKLVLPEEHEDLAPAVADLLSQYRIERHVRRERDEGTNHLNKEVRLSPEFEALWNKIKPKTTFRVEFETDELVRSAVDGIKRNMAFVEKPVVRVKAGAIKIGQAEVKGTATQIADEKVEWGTRPVPDILAYLQNETELTRSTLVRVLKESGRLAEFFNDPSASWTLSL